MATQLESVTFTSGDGETSIPSYLATPDRHGPHPVVLILRGVAGPDDGYTEIARRLAEWGYLALVHGWKVCGADPTDGPVYADLQGALVLHGTRDEQAPIGDMRRMEARMRALGKVCTFTCHEGARHGFAVHTHPGYAGEAAKQSFDEARSFLAMHLPVPRQE